VLELAADYSLRRQTTIAMEGQGFLKVDDADCENGYAWFHCGSPLILARQLVIVPRVFGLSAASGEPCSVEQEALFVR
jgi:hypothetical protein